MVLVLNHYYWRHIGTMIKIYLKTHWILLISIVVVISTPLVIRYETHDLISSKFSNVLITACSLTGVYLLVRSLMKRVRNEVFEHPLGELKPDDLLQSGTDIEMIHHQEYLPKSQRTRLRQAVFSRTLNEKLAVGGIPYKVIKPPWHLSSALEIYQGSIFHSQNRTIKFDGKTVRQEHDLTPADITDQQPISLRQAHYVGGLITNDFTEYRLQTGHRIKPRIFIDGT